MSPPVPDSPLVAVVHLHSSQLLALDHVLDHLLAELPGLPIRLLHAAALLQQVIILALQGPVTLLDLGHTGLQLTPVRLHLGQSALHLTQSGRSQNTRSVGILKIPLLKGELDV